MKRPSKEREIARLRSELETLKSAHASRKLEFEALHDASRLYSAILDALPTEVAVLDLRGEIVAANRAWSVSGEGGAGQNYLEQCFSTEGERSAPARRAGEGIFSVLEGRAGSFSMEYPCHSPQRQRWVSLMVAPIAVERFRGAVILRVDITDRVLAEERASQLAHHDALTGLPNRRLLADRLVHSAAQAKRRRDRMALLYIDLDNLKAVNDWLGHSAGDMMLQEAAKRMRAAIRDTDTLARTGGDEFTLIATELKDAAAADVVASKLVAAVEPPLTIAGEEVRTGASIGIAVWPDDAESLEDLERRADEAMYQAKRAGKNCYRRWGN